MDTLSFMKIYPDSSVHFCSTKKPIWKISKLIIDQGLDFIRITSRVFCWEFCEKSECLFSKDLCAKMFKMSFFKTLTLNFKKKLYYKFNFWMVSMVI